MRLSCGKGGRWAGSCVRVRRRGPALARGKEGGAVVCGCLPERSQALAQLPRVELRLAHLHGKELLLEQLPCIELRRACCPFRRLG